MVVIQVYDGRGTLLTTETRPDPVPNADRAAVRDAIVAIQPNNATTLLLNRTELINIKTALAKLARAVDTAIEVP